MNEATITKALKEVRDAIARAEHERAELDRSIAAGHEEERLLLRILGLRRGDAPSDHTATLTESETVAGTIRRVSELRDGPVTKHPALQAVVGELAAAGRPLHISDLMRLLREAHVQVPGKGTQANLIAHLRRDQRIVRPSRGMYGLSAWGLENMPTTVGQKRHRKRVRLSEATGGSQG